MWTYEVHIIGAKIARFINDNWRVYGTSQAKTLRYLENQLHEICQRIPPLTEIDVFDPHIMDLRLAHSFIKMTLYNFLKRSESPPSDPQDVQQIFDGAQHECLAAAKLVSNLYQRYFREVGSRSLTMWMPQTAMTAAHMMIDHLNEPGVPECFHSVCCVLIAASRRWFTMRGHVRMLFITVEQKGREFPEKTRNLLEQVALRSWAPDEHKLFHASAYPNYSYAKMEDPRMTGMGDLLEQWATFNMKGEDGMDDSVMNTEEQ